MLTDILFCLIGQISQNHDQNCRKGQVFFLEDFPKWINANYSWGTLDETTGQANGAVGLIQRDVADYAIWGFAGTHPRSKVVVFSPGISYVPYYWLTRYPLELSPT